MTYVALDSVDRHIERVAARADRGGHSAPVSKIREIYASSIQHLEQALREFDYVAVYDNSGGEPKLVIESIAGQLAWRDNEIPSWVSVLLR